jgi:hypothetical protein
MCGEMCEVSQPFMNSLHQSSVAFNAECLAQ